MPSLAAVSATWLQVTYLGMPEAMDGIASFLFTFLLCYTTSIDNLNTPWLVGFFAALCCGIGTQYLQPQAADAIAAR